MMALEATSVVISLTNQVAMANRKCVISVTSLVILPESVIIQESKWESPMVVPPPVIMVVEGITRGKIMEIVAMEWGDRREIIRVGIKEPTEGVPVILEMEAIIIKYSTQIIHMET